MLLRKYVIYFVRFGSKWNTHYIVSDLATSHPCKIIPNALSNHMILKNKVSVLDCVFFRIANSIV